jgi:ferredoxin--NADP+ reductase
VAVIGSGPSGFYAAEHLQSQPDTFVQVDMYDRLPTPFGLVRGGVAPDHQKIKSVTRVYDRIAAHPEFRFFGNVELGRDVTHEDLIAYYHAVIYAVGARTDRRMGIPREYLPGSHSATEFVGWYNAHPDFRSLRFDLSGERAVVVGNGNVAMDLARILASPLEDLAHTDIAEHALEALAGSRIREIIVLGRRGPAQAAFTTKELRELGHITGCEFVVDPAEAALDPLSAAEVARASNRTRDRARRGDRRGPQRAVPRRGRPAARPHVRPDRDDPSGPGVSCDRLPGGPAPGHPVRRNARCDSQPGRPHHRSGQRPRDPRRVRGRLDQARAPGDHRDQQAGLL